MKPTDDWSGDPGVRAMRRVFARMERTQKGFLESLGISPHDMRLRSWREKTLRSFERSWAEMTRRRVAMGEERAGMLYVNLLARVMASEGVSIESGHLKKDHELEELLREAGL
ncbi:MAG: hypothetical protein AB1512_09590 [Thermodesulfobacteriota bacterium]